jgi:hypothetical protein
MFASQEIQQLQFAAVGDKEDKQNNSALIQT